MAHTPMMKQYMSIKEQYPGSILFFRMGDFYEMFYEDAEVASQVLEIALTSRAKKDQARIPMCGVPHHAARNYIAKMVQNGFKVAVCEQVEDPATAKGVVRREVTHVVTPGVNLDLEQLSAREHHFLAAVYSGQRGLALAFLDATTGDFTGCSLSEESSIFDELSRVSPKELLVLEDSHLAARLQRVDGLYVNPLAGRYFDLDNQASQLAGVGAFSALPEDLADPMRATVGALLLYLKQTHAKALEGVRSFAPYQIDEYMILEQTSWQNLEIERTLVGAKKKGTLLHLLDRTCTAMGGRLLRRWLAYPLLQLSAIEARLHLVELFRVKSGLREELRKHLGNVYDLERLAGRVNSGLATPREVASLRRSVLELPDILALLQELDDPHCLGLARKIDPLEDVAARIGATLVDEPPAVLKDGGVIRYGFNPELDELLDLCRDGRSWMLNYESEERKATGISSLKVKYNKVFGYYVEVTKANLHLVPEHFIRKQTLVNSERYITEKLKGFEEKVLSAEERRVSLESVLFDELRASLKNDAARIVATAGQISRLDVLTTFGELAWRNNYSRPRLDESSSLSIIGGRHPVLEQLLDDEPFIPNDTNLDTEDAQLVIITGPNMAGKSTVMRQVALIVLMAQIGSFVPAEAATIGLVDRIFTRVGASDNLSRGQSTFMVEMMETASILKNATDRSLIILDEIGRGTSTFDGLSIAWAVAETIHDEIRARTMFATHYHEMVDLAATKGRVKNFSVAVKEWNDDVIFLRQLVEGGVSRSYGIQVAKLAGLPEKVVLRAREILKNLEADEVDEVGAPKLARNKRSRPGKRDGQLMLFSTPPPAEPEPDSIATTLLDSYNLDRLTPLEALQLLYKLKDRLSR